MEDKELCCICQEHKELKYGADLCACVWCSGELWACYECVNHKDAKRKRLKPGEFYLCEFCVPDEDIREALVRSMVDDFIESYNLVRDA